MPSVTWLAPDTFLPCCSCPRSPCHRLFAFLRVGTARSPGEGLHLRPLFSLLCHRVPGSFQAKSYLRAFVLTAPRALAVSSSPLTAAPFGGLLTLKSPVHPPLDKPGSCVLVSVLCTLSLYSGTWSLVPVRLWRIPAAASFPVLLPVPYSVLTGLYPVLVNVVDYSHCQSVCWGTQVGRRCGQAA